MTSTKNSGKTWYQLPVVTNQPSLSSILGATCPFRTMAVQCINLILLYIFYDSIMKCKIRLKKLKTFCNKLGLVYFRFNIYLKKQSLYILKN